MSKQKRGEEITYPAIKASAIDPIPIGDERLPTNENIPTLFADMVNFLGRNDSLAQLRFFSKSPGKNVEIARIMITAQTIANLQAIFESYTKGATVGEKPASK